GDLGEHLDPLVDGEQGLLRDVDENGDDHLIMQAGCPADDVQMTVRYRVERTRAYHPSHAASLLMRPVGRVKPRFRHGCPRLIPPDPLPRRCRTRTWPRRTCATFPRRSRGASQ